MKRTTVTFLAVILIITFSSCATNVNLKKGIKAEEKGEWDKAVLYYTEAITKDNGDIDSRLRLETARRMASSDHLKKPVNSGTKSYMTTLFWNTELPENLTLLTELP